VNGVTEVETVMCAMAQEFARNVTARDVNCVMGQAIVQSVGELANAKSAGEKGL